ncbi:glycoprotein [Saimiriine gammaherpesvirus 2]|uniref:Gene 51 glycoprotein n=1 Tax=Saimiriine herpesvirus 2 (strain 11) TaxID=10383 RepID=VG51_SHV21|nr:glycoprotein [Saimiriine gammaherpesvirus 2]Q01036.1 RecName: Full=Gene 51 glycoprotein [Herpesvirus saimiri (strain 11)]AAA46128.1 transpressor [Saimiriine gammaherpesvirus 2]AAA46160.1 open reading frame A [Saimiriine gammaherpesvirus 2]CAA45674.1 glycoprotein [Saimiriine gammaherpesvirus 2]
MKAQALLLCSLVLLAQSTDVDDEGSGEVFLQKVSSSVSITASLATTMLTSVTNKTTQNVSVTTIDSLSTSPMHNATSNTSYSQTTPYSQTSLSSSVLISTPQMLNSTPNKPLSSTKLTPKSQSSSQSTKTTKQASKNLTTSKLATSFSSTYMTTSDQPYSNNTANKILLNTTYIYLSTLSKITKLFMQEQNKTTQEPFELITPSSTERDSSTLSKHTNKLKPFKPKTQPIVNMQRTWIYPLTGIVSIVVLLIIMSCIHCYIRRFDEHFE